MVVYVYVLQQLQVYLWWLWFVVQPYSETSSGSSTDTEEAPALPPRTWRSKGAQAKPVPAVRQSLSPVPVTGGHRRPRRPYSSGDMLPPSITVSPPHHAKSASAAAALPLQQQQLSKLILPVIPPPAPVCYNTCQLTCAVNQRPVSDSSKWLHIEESYSLRLFSVGCV